MLLAEWIVLCGLFFLMCYLGTGSDEKNIRSYSSYPDDIQKIVREDPKLKDLIRVRPPHVVFLSNVLMFSLILLAFSYPLRQDSFRQNWVTVSLLGQGLNLFDLVVIDLLWWRNSNRVRFSGTEHLVQSYYSPAKHVAAFGRGVLAFLVVAVIDGAILTLL